LRSRTASIVSRYLIAALLSCGRRRIEHNVHATPAAVLGGTAGGVVGCGPSLAAHSGLSTPDQMRYGQHSGSALPSITSTTHASPGLHGQSSGTMHVNFLILPPGRMGR